MSDNAEDILQRFADRCGVHPSVIGEYADDLSLALEDRVGGNPDLYLLIVTQLLVRVAARCHAGQDEALDTAVRLVDVFVELDDTEDSTEGEEEEDGSDEED